MFLPLQSNSGMAGLGFDCSNLSYPSDPTYANCDPFNSQCVAQNGQLNTQHNEDVQAYHDALAACSAQNYVASGGSLTPSALTYGAAQDILNPTAAPYVDSASTPVMATSQQIQNLTPSAAPTQTPAPQPGNVPASTGTTPASQTVPAATTQPGTPPPTPASSGASGSTGTDTGTIFGMSGTTVGLIAAGIFGFFLLKGGK